MKFSPVQRAGTKWDMRHNGPWDIMVLVLECCIVVNFTQCTYETKHTASAVCIRLSPVTLDKKSEGNKSKHEATETLTFRQQKIFRSND